MSNKSQSTMKAVWEAVKLAKGNEELVVELVAEFKKGKSMRDLLDLKATKTIKRVAMSSDNTVIASKKIKKSAFELALEKTLNACEEYKAQYGNYPVEGSLRQIIYKNSSRATYHKVADAIANQGFQVGVSNKEKEKETSSLFDACYARAWQMNLEDAKELISRVNNHYATCSEVDLTIYNILGSLVYDRQKFVKTISRSDFHFYND